MNRMFRLLGPTLLGAALLAGAGWANDPPQVQILDPGTYSQDAAEIRYVLYDADSAALQYALYYYPNERLTSVEDIRVFGTLIADQRDLVHAEGQVDFAPSQAADDVQQYRWTTREQPNSLGFAPIDAVLEGRYYLYLVADDGQNPARFAVSAQAIQIDRGAATAVGTMTWGRLKATGKE